MYCMYYIMTDDYETALKYALKTVREYPTNGDTYYNLGYVYSLLGKTIESAKNYVICSHIYEYNKDPKFEELGMQDLLTHSANEVSILEESLLKNPSISILPLLKQIQEYYNGVDYVYGFNCNIFRASDSIAGDYYYFPKDERYISYYNVSELTNAPQCGNVFQSKFNLLHADLKKNITYPQLIHLLCCRLPLSLLVRSFKSQKMVLIILLFQNTKSSSIIIT